MNLLLTIIILNHKYDPIYPIPHKIIVEEPCEVTAQMPYPNIVYIIDNFNVSYMLPRRTLVDNSR